MFLSKKLLLTLGIAVAVLAGCSPNQQPAQQAQDATQNATNQAQDAAKNATNQAQDAAKNTANQATGLALYTTNCAGCHGAQGGGVQNAGPKITSSEFIGNSSKVQSKVKSGKGKHASFKDKLTDDQVKAIGDFVASLQAQ